jgi:putative oxidoreductase
LTLVKKRTGEEIEFWRKENKMKKIKLFARLLLGSILLVFGLNGWFHFIPIPFTTPQASEFQDALWQSNYLMHLVKAIEVICGLSLLTNRFTTMALLLLLPVSVNILLVDLLLQPQFMFMGILVFGLHALLLASIRKNLAGLLV